MIYFAQDGNYGDATGLVTLDETMINAETWDLIDIALDSDRYEIAKFILLNEMDNLSALAKDYDTNIGLDCAWCDKPVMWEYACPNAGDICVDCCNDCDGGIDD